MHSALFFECLSICVLYLWKCVLVFATKFFALPIWYVWMVSLVVFSLAPPTSGLGRALSVWKMHMFLTYALQQSENFT